MRRHALVVAIGTLIVLLLGRGQARAQAAAASPPPLWDAQVGASFVGTSGNTQASSTGIDFAGHRRGPIWQVESTATTIRTTSDGETTAARYLGNVSARRVLTPRLKLSIGERAERDELSGLNYRNVLDAGLAWGLLRSNAWTLDGTTSAGWNHERRTDHTRVNDTVGVFQLLSRMPFGAMGDTTQRVAWFPDFAHPDAYRIEGEIAAQAAMNSRLALKLGYLVRYANAPVEGFTRTDNTATASVVLRFKSVAPAPNGG